jgi:hypothetical protein
MASGSTAALATAVPADGSNGRQGGVTVALAVGGTVSRRVLFGASVDSWTHSQVGGALTLAMLLARLQFYPSATSGFFLTAGVGLGTVRADATDIGGRSDTGTGALIGLGYDIRVGTNVSLTPFWNGFGTGGIDTNRNVGQLGLSVTVH